jgi:hypothetical protein
LNHPKGTQLIQAMFGGAMNGDFKDEEMDVEEQKPQPKPEPQKKEEEKKHAEQTAKATLNESQKKVSEDIFIQRPGI